MAMENLRTAFLDAYKETREPDMFFAGMFTVRPKNITNAEVVKIDVKRGQEHISPVVHVGHGPTFNTANIFTTKELRPPTISEAMPFNATDFLNRIFGRTEYDSSDVDFQAALMEEMLDGINELEGKIRRNREFQASQILQTGKLALPDEKGVIVYNVDYKPKATHFVTAAIAWNAVGADPVGNIDAMLDVIRNDSLKDGNRVIMGGKSFTAFMNDPTVKSNFDTRNYAIGEIAPEPSGEGGKRQGVLHIGDYLVEIWTWAGRGLLPTASSNTRYMDEDKCIVMATDGRLDTVFAGIPALVKVDPRFADILPGRLSIPQATDMLPNIYTTEDGEQTILKVSSRPLLVPTAIDSFGAINTGV